MMVNNSNIRRLRKALVGSSFGAIFMLGFIGECNDLLIQASRYVDPCGTFLADCAPGDIEVRNAQVGDFCVDPACTLPGGCGDDQPIGTLTEICT